LSRAGTPMARARRLRQLLRSESCYEVLPRRQDQAEALVGDTHRSTSTWLGSFCQRASPSKEHELKDEMRCTVSHPHQRFSSNSQVFFSRPVQSNRRPPVAVYRTGLAGNRLNSKPNSKSHVQPVPTGLPIRSDRVPVF